MLQITTYQCNQIIKTLFNRNNDVMLEDGELLSNCLKGGCKHPEHNKELQEKPEETPDNRPEERPDNPEETNDKYLSSEDELILCTEDNKMFKLN